MAAAMTTAMQRGIVRCEGCGLLCAAPTTDEARACPRCELGLHARKQNSLLRSCAFLIAAYVLYVPANLLPIMSSSSLLGQHEDTIMSGAIYLWSSGSWPLALIVIVASIVVPLAKMLALSFLLFTVQRNWAWGPAERTRLYRVTESIGRWSMVDIFVVALLVALVNSRATGEVDAGPAAVAFGAVVVMTMAATLSFDPRLIWDAAERGKTGSDGHG